MYNYIFYRFYKIAKVIESQHHESMRTPVSVAMGLTFLLQGSNLLALFIFLVHYFEMLRPSSLGPEVAVAVFTLFYGLNYFLFVRNKKYLRIEKKFDNESVKLRVIKKSLFWFYVVLSVFLLIYAFTAFEPVR